MEILNFKFQQYFTINKQFDFYEGRGVSEGRATPFVNFNLNYCWYAYITFPSQISAKSIKFEETILSRGEDGGHGDPISRLLLVHIWKCRVSHFSIIAPYMMSLTFLRPLSLRNIKFVVPGDPISKFELLLENMIRKCCVSNFSKITP